ncbi:SAM-dependent methyltransferase [Kibdelosporangium banguiense]|uniref:SAM-dependent methyltransferase n=1 Tax=Kibdelosporangium banguiense TaxID=1365924 RepID=A0ABS4TTM4_9PSEU|nr:class I SAM-dependent methyltransferase [Kibdelosporangium banguiense]MBP2327281.1 SAM-dependent methyltransferase [Kibdelosporangium banguiense]
MSGVAPGADDLDPRTQRAQQVYTERILSIYDPLVLRVFCTFIWRCPPRTMVGLYDRLAGRRHLDLGPGTGFFLDRCRFPVRDPEITLVDLNENCLTVSARRLSRYRPATHQANILQPLPLPAGHFDSVALNLVMHTIPGGWETKGQAFRHAATCLRPGGTLFGTTVLERGVPMNRLTRKLMAEQHRRGNFQNQGDDPAGLTEQLKKYFPVVKVVTVGCVALFETRTDGGDQ